MRGKGAVSVLFIGFPQDLATGQGEGCAEGWQVPGCHLPELISPAVQNSYDDRLPHLRTTAAMAVVSKIVAMFASLRLAPRLLRFSASAVVLLTISFTACEAADGTIDFARDIRPLLSENCFHCHGPDANDRQADLRLDTESGLRDWVTAEDRQASELFQRIASKDPDLRMPPPHSNRNLSAEEVELIGVWIDQGATWNDHWSYSPLTKPLLPDPKILDDESRANLGPIDQFVHAELKRQGLRPAEATDPARRLRRVSLDLTGLPPTAEQLDAFLAEPSDEAYQRMVDQLMQSPAFGQRMAWDWLDAARYADSNGYQGDRERTMWPWRDWVVDAFNRNLPFDQFTLWQVAGDLLPNATDEQKLASGFFRNHMINGEGGRIAEENRVEYVFDMTETLGTVWLGLTLNCCRCHDHKYDPISQRDYFALFDLFNQTPVNGAGGDPQTPPVLEVPSRQQQLELNSLRESLALVQAKYNDAAVRPAEGEKQGGQNSQPEEVSPLRAEWEAEKSALEKQLTSLRARIPKVMIMADQPQRRKTFMLEVGLYNKPGAEVTGGVPAFLPPLPQNAPANRLGLAQWLIHDEQPLMARVIVNRFWQMLFGVGLVNTPDDFGVQGEIPRYQSLLDYLAADFRDHGWDVKRLIRQIVTSNTYQQSSAVSAEAFERDPENRLLARGPRHRLPAWMLRDQALAVSGLLVPIVGGKPVNGYQPEGIWEEATFGKKRYVQDHGEALYRRTLYTFWRRIVSPTVLFDNASRQMCSVTPRRTNTPLHALVTLNETTYVEASRALAQRVLLWSPDPHDVAEEQERELELQRQRIGWAFRQATSRYPNSVELDLLQSRLLMLLDSFSEDPQAAEQLVSVGESSRDPRLAVVQHAAWTTLCSLILNLDETVTKP